MLLSLLVSLLDLTVIHSATINTPLYNNYETSPSSSHSQNLPTVTTNTTILDSIFPETNIDPRFSYKSSFSHQILNKESAYLNVLLALADLSTKGWTVRLKWESIYSLSSYGDVTIRIHAAQNPSSLMYRHAIWGLYLAIRESSANGFKACVLTLYWSPILGGTRHRLGFVSILGAPSLSMDIGNSTEETLDSALPTQATSTNLALPNFTTINNSSTSLAIETGNIRNLDITISLENRPLGIDAMFHTIYLGMVYLASMPQDQRIDEPGFVEDRASLTFLRWDSSYLVVQPTFQYQHAISALAAVPVYICNLKQFKEVRFIVQVDTVEVGRGWLYKQRIREASNAD